MARDRFGHDPVASRHRFVDPAWSRPHQEVNVNENPADRPEREPLSWRERQKHGDECVPMEAAPAVLDHLTHAAGYATLAGQPGDICRHRALSRGRASGKLT